jgi:hypothetical protein
MTSMGGALSILLASISGMSDCKAACECQFFAAMVVVEAVELQRGSTIGSGSLGESGLNTALFRPQPETTFIQTSRQL